MEHNDFYSVIQFDKIIDLNCKIGYYSIEFAEQLIQCTDPCVFIYL